MKKIYSIGVLVVCLVMTMHGYKAGEFHVPVENSTEQSFIHEAYKNSVVGIAEQNLATGMQVILTFSNKKQAPVCYYAPYHFADYKTMKISTMRTVRYRLPKTSIDLQLYKYLQDHLISTKNFSIELQAIGGALGHVDVVVAYNSSAVKFEKIIDGKRNSVYFKFTSNI